MKKGIIYGIGNYDRYCYFILKKEKSVLLKLVKLISLLSKSQGCYASDKFIEYEEYDEKYEKSKRIKIKISDLLDRRHYFSDKGFDIDVVFGKNRVFVIMYADKKIRNNVRKFIRENFKFVKVKKPRKKKISYQKLKRK